MESLKYGLAALLAAFSAHAAAVGSMADITVFDRSEGRKLPVYWHEGRAYVVGKPGNEYQLSLRSRQGEDVLAVLSVDGSTYHRRARHPAAKRLRASPRPAG